MSQHREAIRLDARLARVPQGPRAQASGGAPGCISDLSLLDNAEALRCDPSRRAVVRESSGATIAANLVVLLRDLDAPAPNYQVLAYPVADSFDRWPSYTERGDGYILDRRLMAWYFSHCVPAEPSAEPAYFTQLATEDLSGLPSTLILTAEFDPLRDEGLAYARRLAEAGVEVEHVHAAQQISPGTGRYRRGADLTAVRDGLQDWGSIQCC